MPTEISLLPIQMLDLFFRFASVGVLMSLLLIPRKIEYWWNKALIVCCIGYLLLTAPIDNAHYGWLRPPLLMMTDLTPLALLGVYWLHVHGRSIWSELPFWSRSVLVIGLLWLAYFFLIQAGKGVFHDINHALGFSLLIYILIDAGRGLSDDLVDRRRRWRLSMIVIISSYMALLTLLELTMSMFKDHWLFSLGNSLFALILCLIVAQFVFHKRRDKPPTNFDHKTSDSDQANVTETIGETPLTDLVSKLESAMKSGAYKQNGLTINQLARQLEVPAHQLRRLINTELGFENFSQFLNSYRLPAVYEALKDPKRKQEPILTLALEAGFNSIAPFNRAFKQAKGVTPTQYRDQF